MKHVCQYCDKILPTLQGKNAHITRMHGAVSDVESFSVSPASEPVPAPVVIKDTQQNRLAILNDQLIEKYGDAAMATVRGNIVPMNPEQAVIESEEQFLGVLTAVEGEQNRRIRK